MLLLLFGHITAKPPVVIVYKGKASLYKRQGKALCNIFSYYSYLREGISNTVENRKAGREPLHCQLIA